MQRSEVLPVVDNHPSLQTMAATYSAYLTPSVVSENDLKRKKPTWERRLEEAKKKHRPKLKDWSRDGFAIKRNSDFEHLRSNACNDVRDLNSCPVNIDSSYGHRLGENTDTITSDHSNHDAVVGTDDKNTSKADNHCSDRYVSYSSHANLAPFRPEKNRLLVDKSDNEIRMIDRIKCKNMSPDQFIEFYERRCLPCVISGIPKGEHWAAQTDWNFDREVNKESSAADDKDQSLMPLGDSFFKVGEDDDGYKVKVKLKYFLKYLSLNRDDSPLYIFDRYHPLSSCYPIMYQMHTVIYHIKQLFKLFYLPSCHTRFFYTVTSTIIRLRKG